MKNCNVYSKLVYSTLPKAVCSECGLAIDRCRCQDLTAVPNIDGVARLFYETKGRKGKKVTVIAGLALSKIELGALAKKLKQRFGTGGTVNNFLIELQGDFTQLAAQELRKLGFRVK